MITPFPEPHTDGRTELPETRHPRREAVTIIAGFKCQDGIVVCADTQETVEPLKRNVTKLRFEPNPNASGWIDESDSGLAMAFCGAGHGPFIDKMVDVAWQKSKDAPSLDEACLIAENSIKDHYAEYGQIYQRGYCPEVNVLFGAKMHGDSKLFSAVGPVVNRVETYECHGAGLYMADFLASRMYGQHLTVHQCFILAAYILFQCKEHVDGCGGTSHIAVLRDAGRSGPVNLERTETVTKFLSEADQHMSYLLLQTADLNEDTKSFRRAFNASKDELKAMREYYLGEMKEQHERSNLLSRNESDLLGLPIRGNNGSSI